MYAHSSRTMAGAKRLAETRRPERSREEVTVRVIYPRQHRPAPIVRVVEPVKPAKKKQTRARQLPPYEPFRYPRSAPLSKHILAFVCNLWKVPPQEVLGKDLARSVTVARQAYIYHLRRRLKWSFPQIGRLLRMDHSSAITAFYVYPKNRAKRKALASAGGQS